MYGQAVCPKDNENRSPDWRVPCPGCGARRTWLGYLRPHEYRGCMTALITVLVIAFLTTAAVIGFWLFMESRLTRVSTSAQVIAAISSISLLSA